MKRNMYVRVVAIGGLLSLPTPMGNRHEVMYVCKIQILTESFQSVWHLFQVDPSKVCKERQTILIRVRTMQLPNQ